jgi:hypothetical protein
LNIKSKRGKRQQENGGQYGDIFKEKRGSSESAGKTGMV